MSSDKIEHSPDCHVHTIMAKKLCALEKDVKGKIAMRLFMWIIGAIGAVLVLVGSAHWALTNEVAEIKTSTAVIQSELMHQSEMMKRIERKVSE